MFFDGKRSDILDINELWDFGAKRNLNQHSVDLNLMEEGLKQANTKLEIITSKFKNEVNHSLNPVVEKIKRATTSYYLNQTNRLESEIAKVEPVKNESPSTSRKYNNLLYELEVLAKHYTDDLRKVEKDMQVGIVTELIGISLIVPSVSDIQKDSDHKQNKRPFFIPKRSEFTKLNNQINNELSTTTHERLAKNPNCAASIHG